MDQRPSRRAWIIGGSLILASVLVGFVLRDAAYLIPGGAYLPNALFSAALLLFAFGIRGAGSVTARRPLGTAALTLLAVWTLGWPLLLNLLLTDEYSPAFQGVGYVDLVVQLVLAVVAVTQIARAGVVPRPWKWAPAWALAAVVVPQLLEQVLVIGMTAQDSTSAIMLALTFEGLLRTGAMLFLGVLAIVLGNRPAQPQRVTVIPSAGVEH